MTRDAGPVKGGSTVIAFVKDPTGYLWEIIGRGDKPIPEPIAQVKSPQDALPRSLQSIHAELCAV